MALSTHMNIPPTVSHTTPRTCMTPRPSMNLSVYPSPKSISLHNIHSFSIHRSVLLHAISPPTNRIRDSVCHYIVSVCSDARHALGAIYVLRRVHGLHYSSTNISNSLFTAAIQKVGDINLSILGSPKCDGSGGYWRRKQRKGGIHDVMFDLALCQLVLVLVLAASSLD